MKHPRIAPAFASRQHSPPGQGNLDCVGMLESRLRTFRLSGERRKNKCRVLICLPRPEAVRSSPREDEFLDTNCSAFLNPNCHVELVSISLSIPSL